MKEILVYLTEHSYDICLIVFKQIIYFIMDNDVEVVIELKDDSPYLALYENESYVNGEDLNVERLQLEDIQCLDIRKGFSIYEDDDKSYYTNVSYTALCCLSLLYSKYKDVVVDYHIDDISLDNDHPMCPSVYDYGFKIIINQQYWTNCDFFKYLYSITLNFKKYIDIQPEEREIKDSYEHCVLPSNTKTRRLGYIKIITDLFSAYPQIPANKLNRRFEDYCQRFSDYFKDHKNSKGYIKVTKTGNSAKPYIELAQKMGFIQKMGNVYQIGKIGKSYIALKCEIDDSVLSGNPFELTPFDKTFFTELIIKEDYLYIKLLLTQIKIRTRPQYSEIKLTFKDVLLKQLDCIIAEATFDDSPRRFELVNVKRRVKNWDKPNTYLEHVIMPRLNWLYDLELIDMNNKLVVSLTHKGECLLSHLLDFDDIVQKQVLSPIPFLNRSLMSIINNVQVLNCRRMLESDENQVLQLLQKCFSLFKTLAPNRVTFSQADMYIRYIMLCTQRVIVERKELMNLLDSKYDNSYIFMYQNQYNDGYIQKK